MLGKAIDELIEATSAETSYSTLIDWQRCRLHASTPRGVGC
jgi:hypothetical protein